MKSPPSVQKYHALCKRTVDRERIAAKRNSGGEHLKKCAACGKEFVSKRSDAKTCGTKCRVALSRAERSGDYRKVYELEAAAHRKAVTRTATTSVRVGVI
jgi:hypothetical protein